MGNLEATDRTKIKRLPKRASYNKKIMNKILDSSFVCHIGFNIADQPFVIPTCYGVENEKIFFHGSAASRMLDHIKTGSEICIAVTIVDGIVLARSAFHHSINYKSLVIFGKAAEITGKEEKIKALKIITEHIIPGRWDDVRKPNKKELNATLVFSLNLDEVSAKVREGGPSDEDADMDLNIWAGVLPLKVVPGEPVADYSLNKNILLPEYTKNYKIQKS